MSDLNEIFEDLTIKIEQQEQEQINDKTDELSSTEQEISPESSPTSESDSQEIHINKIADEFESKLSVKTFEEEENDSEYEDVDASILTTVSNKISTKPTTNDVELYINIRPRRMNKKQQDDEHSEDDDNQNVPKTIGDKNRKQIDDDNDAQNPAYIPRKGKFYEHDDRTADENDQSKQDNRFYKDSDAKWPHDLYFQDEQELKSPRRERGHIGHGGDYHRRQVPNESYSKFPNESYNKFPNDRINNFDVKDYDRSLSNNRNRNINNYEQTQEPFRRQQRDNNQYKIDEQTQEPFRRQQRDNNQCKIDEQTFHRRRNFTNSQFQQQYSLSKNNANDQIRDDTGRGKYQQQNQGLRSNERFENINNVSPRQQIYENNRNLVPKQQYPDRSNANSTDAQNTERSKRYSNMRNNITNSIQQLASYKDQRSNNFEQNDWPQAPPPPTSSLSKQNITSQMYHHQPTNHAYSQYQQASRYVPMNYSHASVAQHLQENK